jgi:hypothetical protein
MNAPRTLPREIKADRRGLTHVSAVVARLLAMYGITEERESGPQPSPARVPVVPIGQQTFAWVKPDEITT